MPRPRNTIEFAPGKVRELRQALDYTQEQFLELDGITMSLTVLQRIENGAPASREHARQLQEYLGSEIYGSAEAPAATAVASSSDDDLAQQHLTLSFKNTVELMGQGVEPVLNAFFPDVDKGTYADYRFDPRQLSIVYSPAYLLARAQCVGSENIAVRRTVKRYEEMHTDGVIILLNWLYLREKMFGADLIMQSLYWFSHAVISSSVRTVLSARLTTPEALAAADALAGEIGDKPQSAGPLSFFSVNMLYGSEMTKVDLFDPSDHSTCTSAYVRQESLDKMHIILGPNAAREDFKYASDFTRFIVPQHVLRHLINGERLIEDWSKMIVGYP